MTGARLDCLTNAVDACQSRSWFELKRCRTWSAPRRSPALSSRSRLTAFPDGMAYWCFPMDDAWVGAGGALKMSDCRVLNLQGWHNGITSPAQTAHTGETRGPPPAETGVSPKMGGIAVNLAHRGDRHGQQSDCLHSLKGVACWKAGQDETQNRCWANDPACFSPCSPRGESAFFYCDHAGQRHPRCS